MGIFDTATSTSPLAVDGGPFVVRVSRIAPNADPTKDPTWGDFAVNSLLRFDGAFHGSSVAGMSYGRLKLAAGAPATDPADYLESEDALALGDRVIVSIQEGETERPLFAGYAVQAQILISPDGESLVYRLAGPEWAWGANPLEGVDVPIVGQIRRKAAADDAFVASVSGTPIVTAQADLFIATDERAAFNPAGRKNMTAAGVTLFNDVTGFIWESPDRKAGSYAMSSNWDMLNACRTLINYYNDDWAGIVDPTDWTSTTPIPQDILPECDVDGLGLWEALRKICAPEYQFFVSPVPTAVDAWGGFALKFFRRGVDIDGGSASLTLNPRGTPAASATASIVRLEAAKDIAKTVNRVTVLGKAIRHVRLRYHGADTPTLAAATKKLSLQHGWAKGEGDLNDYSANDADAGYYVVNLASIEGKSDSVQQQWRDRYVVGGKEFSTYRHVFRLFLWNEAGELKNAGADTDAQKPLYNASALAWYAPDLSAIADDTGFVTTAHTGQYARRRRRLLDTPYPDPTAPGDQWRRVPPTVWLCAQNPTGTTLGPWVRLRQGSDYEIDPERGALWITHNDLSLWYPLDRRQDDADLEDPRSFATLLLLGKLRLLVEASIETDHALAATSERTADSGSAFVRQAAIRGERMYAKSLEYADGVTSPSGLTAVPFDNSGAAQDLADQHRLSGHDQATHCSILAAADWPLQGIGKVATATAGRAINLCGGASGRGAQVVALHLDPVAMKVELLTESAALQLRKLDRFRIGAAKDLRGRVHGARRFGGLPQEGE